MKSIIYHTIVFTICLTISTSCGLRRDYQRDTRKVDSISTSLYRELILEKKATSSNTPSFGHAPWQTIFTDTLLQQYISVALQHNTDLKQATLAVQQAEIGLKINKLEHLPQFSFNPKGTSTNVFVERFEMKSTYEIPISASWQVDLFGQLFNVKKQGENTLLQAKAMKQAVHTSVVTSVALLYYSLQMLDEQLTTTQRTIQLWKENIEVMEALKSVGYTNSAAIASAKAQVLKIQAGLPQIQQNIRETETALCLLLHQSPQTIQRNPTISFDNFPKSFELGLPLHLLSDRPDVAIAESKLASAFYGVQGARSAFYPNLTLTAQGTFVNSMGGVVINPSHFMTVGIASLTQPLFAKGKIRGNYKIAKLKKETAQLEFERTLLKASMEVSDALHNYHSVNEKRKITEKQLQQLKKANDDTYFLFRNGNTTTYLETLTAQMNLLNGHLTLTNLHYEQLRALISLYKALGGGKT